MKDKCYVCKTSIGIGPKVIKSEKISDKRFINPVLTLKSLIICDKCFRKIQDGEIRLQNI